MKKIIITFYFLSFLAIVSFGQITDKMVSNCVMKAGPSAKYLKDFRIQLGKGTVRDELKRVIVSSFDSKTKKIYPYVDFVCNKSGIYELNYDFKDSQPGSGVGLVSMVK